jgi:hypothetical protein
MLRLAVFFCTLYIYLLDRRIDSVRSAWNLEISMAEFKGWQPKPGGSFTAKLGHVGTLHVYKNTLGEWAAQVFHTTSRGFPTSAKAQVAAARMGTKQLGFALNMIADLRPTE